MYHRAEWDNSNKILQDSDTIYPRVKMMEYYHLRNSSLYTFNQVCII